MSTRLLSPIEFDRVADLYDDFVCTEFDVPFWLDESKSVSGKVLELACGTGRVSIPLLKAGVDLSCVDYAPEMIARFRQKLEMSHLSCPLYCQDMAELELPHHFDLIFISFHSFSELIDKQRQRFALRRIRSHLTKEGRFICTLQNPAVRTRSLDGKMRLIGEFPLPGGGMLVVRTRLSFNSSTQIASGEQVYDRLSPEKVLVEQHFLNINFYLFNKLEFESLLSESGYSIEALCGDYENRPFEEGTSPYMIWKLRRSANDLLD